MKILEHFKNPIFFGVAVGLIMLILFYLDSKISKKERSKLDYIKLFLSTGAVSGGLQFLITNSFTTQKGGSNISPITEEPKVELNDENVSELISKQARSYKKMHTDLPSW